MRDLLKLIPQERLTEACSSHGIAADEVVARTMALLSKLEAPRQPQEPATVTALGAYRPAGTAAAAAAITADANAMRSTQLEAENTTLKVQMRELLQLCAEPAMGEETGGQHSAKRKKLESAMALAIAA